MGSNELALIGQVVFGYVVAWGLRAPKSVPLWLTWALIGIVGAGVYVWITPAFAEMVRGDWRSVLAGFASFVLSVRGAAGAAKDSKTAPAEDSR